MCNIVNKFVHKLQWKYEKDITKVHFSIGTAPENKLENGQHKVPTSIKFKHSIQKNSINSKRKGTPQLHYTPLGKTKQLLQKRYCFSQNVTIHIKCGIVQTFSSVYCLWKNRKTDKNMIDITSVPNYMLFQVRSFCYSSKYMLCLDTHSLHSKL